MKYTHKFLTVFLTLALLLSAMPARSARAAAGDVVFGWAKSISRAQNNATAKAIAVDSAGNVYTAGYFNGTVDLDPGAGSYNLTSAGGEDIFISKLNSSGNFVWARRMGSTGADSAYAITVDSAGNVYTTGAFEGTVDFDPSAVGTNYRTSAGNKDVFVSKLNSSGNYVWAKAMGGVGIEQANSIALDSTGNVHTTGIFYSTADFDPHPTNTANLTSVGECDIFVSKLNSSGNYLWAKSMGGTSFDEGHGVAVDSAGNVYTAGYFNGTADFNPGTGITNLISAGGRDVFVSKLDSSGDYVRSKRMGGAGDDRAYAIALDSAGNVYTSGYFYGTADFDPHPTNTANLTSAGDTDIFVSKLDSSGDYLWARHMGGPGKDAATAIALDNAGNVYTSGYFRDTPDFDPGAGAYNLTSEGAFDIFVSKLNTSGNFAWTKSMGGATNDIAYAIAVDSAGNVCTSGHFTGTVDFDPGTGVYNLTSAGGTDVFVSKLVNKKSLTMRSQKAYDGWILESSETSGIGGTKNNTSKTFFVGDDASNRQYRSILSFNTSGLPDDAIITKAILKVKKAGMVGANPLKTHGGLYTDIRKNKFGTSKKLQLSDFKAAASKNKVGKFKKASSGWYKATLGSGAYPHIKLNGTTQFRLRFAKDDNNDFGADYLKFYSGNAGTSSRPQLIVEYYVP